MPLKSNNSSSYFNGHSEKELKGVNERLASLEQTIHTLIANTQPSATSDSRSGWSRLNVISQVLEVNLVDSFEGASSFTAHSIQVSQAFGSDNTPTRSVTPSAPNARKDPSDYMGKQQIVGRYELPQMSLVLSILKLAKSRSLNPIFRRYPVS